MPFDELFFLHVCLDVLFRSRCGFVISYSLAERVAPAAQKVSEISFRVTKLTSTKSPSVV